MPPTPSIAYWLNAAKKLVAPVEGRITHNEWIKIPGNAEKLGITAQEALTAHPDLATVRALGRNMDVSPIGEGRITPDFLRRLSELTGNLPEAQTVSRVRLNGANEGYNAPLADWLNARSTRDLTKEYCSGGSVTPQNFQVGGLAKASRALASNPAWLKSALSAKALAGSEDEALRATNALRKIQSLEGQAPALSDDLLTGLTVPQRSSGLSPEEANILLRNTLKMRPPSPAQRFEQLPIEGMSGGGQPKGKPTRPLAMYAGRNINSDRSVTDPEDAYHSPTWSEIGEKAIDESALNLLPLGGLAKLAGKAAKVAAPVAASSVPVLAAAASDDAEASVLGRALRFNGVPKAALAGPAKELKAPFATIPGDKNQYVVGSRGEVMAGVLPNGTIHTVPKLEPDTGLYQLLLDMQKANPRAHGGPVTPPATSPAPDFEAIIAALSKELADARN